MRKPKKAQDQGWGELPQSTMDELQAITQAKAHKKLDAIERTSWYIMGAMRYKIQQLEKTIEEAKKAENEDTPKILTRSMEGMISYCEQALHDYRNALAVLEQAGIR